MDDPVFYVSGHNDDENYEHKNDNNDDTQGSSTVPYPRAISKNNTQDFEDSSSEIVKSFLKSKGFSYKEGQIPSCPPRWLRS